MLNKNSPALGCFCLAFQYIVVSLYTVKTSADNFHSVIKPIVVALYYDKYVLVPLLLMQWLCARNTRGFESVNMCVNMYECTVCSYNGRYSLNVCMLCMCASVYMYALCGCIPCSMCSQCICNGTH